MEGYRKSNETQRTTGYDQSNAGSNTTADYSARTPLLTTDSSPPTSDHGTRTSTRTSWQGSQGFPHDNIKLIPIKAKDLMNVFKNNPAYSNKTPVMINANENDVDEILQKYKNSDLNVYVSPNASLKKYYRESPMSVRRSTKEDSGSIKPLGKTYSPRSSNRSYKEDMVPRSSLPLSDQEPGPSKPPLGENQTPQVYAMTDIQAYPMIGSTGFRANKSRKRKKTPRPRSRKRITPARRVRRSPLRKRSPSRKRSRSRRRPRSRRRKSKPRRAVRLRPKRRSPVIIIPPKRPVYRECCTPYPLCDTQCIPIYDRPTRYPTNSRTRMPLHSTSRPVIEPSTPMMCDCYQCMNKLQFIQPGVCSKKKCMWTNEYAVLPKPQVNMIDPCEELDPSIYPRADNPCIRDGRGNPLTDCIGRPLRDPIGKRFLRFSGNGSVMDTNFRGNFYSGQPPLCVKCPMPGTSCAPDTTHNWWMSCGYPIRPDMTPYQHFVVARENNPYQ